MIRAYDEAFFSRFEDAARRVLGDGDFRGESRQHHDVRVRGVAWRLLHDIGGLSYPEIGQAYGRHHTNIMRTVKKLRPPDIREEREVVKLKAWLEGEGA